jgi:hypothetical protein
LEGVLQQQHNHSTRTGFSCVSGNQLHPTIVSSRINKPLDLTAAIMSVFSKIKLSRKAAKEHKHKVAEKEADKPVKVPYRHVPTHAAVDALSGAPSSWQQEDRSKIMEHHKRRSQMVISRTGSSLSTTSYMNAAAGPSSQAPPLPRNNSYNSYNPTWFNRDGDVYYLNSEPQHKKFKPSRGHSYHDSGIGPSPLVTATPSEGTSSLSSLRQAETPVLLTSPSQSPVNTRLTCNAEVSPVVSSGNSTTSNSSDHLEIAVAPNANPDRMSIRPQPMVYPEKDIFERLHTSTTRKLGEAPLFDGPPEVAKPIANIVAQEKPKKSRWSLMGKKNAAAITV